ncbi:MAG: tyrosine-type recombinase/integrase [Clostridia bacterium]|nr:tyrosine-type recombinase/integrase [Clostridia bacterium]
MRIITKDILKMYEQYLINDEKANLTVEKYMRDVLHFYRLHESRELKKADIMDYKNDLLGQYAVTSVNSMLSSLNNFFAFMGWHELRVKTVRIQKQLFSGEDKSLDKSEYQKLINAARKNKKEQLSLIMQCICSTGIRVSELKYITAEALEKEKTEITNKGKRRVVFLPHKLCKILKAYIKQQKISSGPVFVTKNGKPLDRSNICNNMKKLCKEAGVAREKVFPHNLRHLFARTYYSMQKDIVRLADILGHSGINTTRIYTMETGEIHKKQIQNLGLLLC